jgi:predicted transcriptional regulator
MQSELPGRALHFSAQSVRENQGCSYNTASAALNGLVEKKLFIKQKEGREWVFIMHLIQSPKSHSSGNGQLS